MSLTPITPDLSTGKDFKDLTFPAKFLLWGALAASCAAILWFWGLIVPFVLATAANTVGLALMLIALAIITSPLWNSDVKRYLLLKYDLTMRKLLKAVVDDDPIGVLRRNITKLKEQSVKFSTAVTQVATGKKALELDIIASQNGIAENKRLAASTDQATAAAISAYQNSDNPSQKQELQLKVERLKLQKGGYEQSAGIQMQSIKDEQSILDTTNEMYMKLCRLRDLAEFKVDQLTQQADFYEKRRKIIMGAQAGINAGRNILKGDPKELELVDMAINKLNDETANTLGEMDDFNRWSDKHLTDMDIRNGAAAAEGRNLFAAVENKLTAGTSNSIPQFPVLTAVQGSDGIYSTPSSSSTPDYLKMLK